MDTRTHTRTQAHTRTYTRPHTHIHTLAHAHNTPAHAHTHAHTYTIYMHTRGNTTLHQTILTRKIPHHLDTTHSLLHIQTLITRALTHATHRQAYHHNTLRIQITHVYFIHKHHNTPRIALDKQYRVER